MCVVDILPGLVSTVLRISLMYCMYINEVAHVAMCVTRGVQYWFSLFDLGLFLIVLVMCRCGQLVATSHEVRVSMPGFHKGKRGVQEKVECLMDRNPQAHRTQTPWSIGVGRVISPK